MPMRDMTRENLFERWLEDVVRAAGPYEDYPTFSQFSESIEEKTSTAGRSDTPGAVHGSAGLPGGGATKPAR